jgi:hypothetical protein
MPAAVARAIKLIGSIRHLLWVWRSNPAAGAADCGFGRFVTAISIDRFDAHA